MLRAGDSANWTHSHDPPSHVVDVGFRWWTPAPESWGSSRWLKRRRWQKSVLGKAHAQHRRSPPAVDGIRERPEHAFSYEGSTPPADPPAPVRQRRERDV